MAEAPVRTADGTLPECDRGGRWALAIDVGGSSAKVALVREDGTTYPQAPVPTAHLRGSAQLPGQVVAIAADTVRVARDAGFDVRAVGMVVPGIVDASTGRGVSSMLLGWRDVPFADLVREATGLPTAVDHDVRTAARAELATHPGVRDALFVTVGTGVGAAALVDGELRTGAHGYGGEIAHVIVDPDGPPCPCGKRGCVETIASAPAIGAAYALGGGASSIPPDRVPTVLDVLAGVRRGDRAAASVWDRAARALGRAVAVYSEILDPALVLIGGGVSAAGDLLLDPVRDEVHRGVGLPVRPEVRIAALGNTAGVRGAAVLAFRAAGRRSP
ncbi:ROK family protein [Nakamurella endophytica]|uniref:Sugar kinase n=1 Tax=Nakamurella endophytica TaxID=1748367 RepID=A0A917TBG2_9ACTN|nr:ROK family protein [Nakamurella endophytica]GGM17512.1 sugar kinase [Nakamurella endophytica]